jgi:HK97 gp10 family phage protein
MPASTFTYTPNPSLRQDVARSTEVRDELGVRGEAVAARAQALAPRDTGALAASISSSLDLAGVLGWEATIEAAVRYAVFVEYGTSDTPAQPFLRPAGDEVF